MSIAIHRFGSAHWSVLQHVHHARQAAEPHRLDRSWMRCNERRHPEHRHPDKTAWDSAHGTMLAGYDQFRGSAQEAAAAGCQILEHDDWDCLADLEAAGLVISLTAHGHARLTPAGEAIQSALNEHLSQGSSIAVFRWPPPCLN